MIVIIVVIKFMASRSGPSGKIPYEHRWELPGNCPVFTVVMVIYNYIERIWRILVTPIYIYNIYDH